MHYWVPPGGSRAEPEPDRCDGDGAVEDAGPFVEPRGQRPEVLELVDRPLNMDLASRTAPGAPESLVGAVLPGRAPFRRHSRHAPSGPGSVLVGPAGGRIDVHHRPVDPAFRVSVGQDGREDPVPRAVRRPASVSLVSGLPRTEARRQIPPWHPGAKPVRDPLMILRCLIQRPPRCPDFGRCGRSRTHSACVRSPRPMTMPTSRDRDRNKIRRTGPSPSRHGTASGAVSTGGSHVREPRQRSCSYAGSVRKSA